MKLDTKIKIDAVTDEQFCEIFRRVAKTQGLACDVDVLMELASFIRETLNEPLRPCYPRDLMNQICWAAKFEARRPALDREALRHAVESYFVIPT